MRAVRVLGLVVVVTVTGLLSGGAAGADPTSVPSARVAVASPALAVPAVASAPTTAPAPTAPDPAVAAAAPAPAAAPPKPTPVAAPPAAPPKPSKVQGTPCLSTARACVQLSTNRAWLIRDGVVQYGPVPITHGRKGFRTPAGTFRVSFKSRDHVSSIYDASMPNSVFFNGGIAFHQGSLKQLSHGCIHLSRTASRTFFDALGRGAVVQVLR